MSDDIFNDLRSASNEPTEAILVSSDLLIEAAEEIDRLRALITTWADAFDRVEYWQLNDGSELDAYYSAVNALRKAVGR